MRPSGLALLLVALIVADALFLGVIVGLIPRLLGVAAWYRGVGHDETIVYRGFAGAHYSGWRLHGVTTLISDRRLVVRLFWSRLALVDASLAAIHQVRPSRRWWYPTVKVTYETDRAERDIELLGTRRERSAMLSAFRSLGVWVIDDSFCG